MTGIEAVALRSGLMLQLAHIAPAAAFTRQFAIQESPVIFGFMLAGQNVCHYSEGALRRTKAAHGGGSNRITYLPETVGSMECTGGMHRLSILASREFLEPYLSAETARMPRDFAGALAGNTEAFQWTGQHCIQKMRLVAEMFTNAHCGGLRRLHLETRALELIGMQLSEYLTPTPQPTLKGTDISRIREARELLVQDMENPPSMAQLARMAGINEKKLKHGFKQVFGVPVFEYFRAYRLEIARELLTSGGMNVTEVGVHIGYQNLSHFSEAFRKKFGVTPKQFQKR